MTTEYPYGEGWTLANPKAEDQYTISINEESIDEDDEKVNVLNLHKKNTAEFNFDDALEYKLQLDDASQTKKIGHIQFYCKTSSTEAESCNFRLYSRKAPEPDAGD